MARKEEKRNDNKRKETRKEEHKREGKKRKEKRGKGKERKERKKRKGKKGTDKKITMRRVEIGKEQVRKYGLTVGCKGCTQADEGRAIEGHNEECRTRMEAEMAKDGNRKLIKMEERMGREGQ